MGSSGPAKKKIRKKIAKKVNDQLAKGLQHFVVSPSKIVQ
jgi:hypothetical protein